MMIWVDLYYQLNKLNNLNFIFMVKSNDKMIEMTVSDDSIRLLLPISIIVSAILIVAALMYSTETVKDAINKSKLGNQTEIEQNVENDDQNVVVNVSKTDKPVVDLFVWSFCPGGVYGEQMIKPTVDLLKDKADFRVRFIGPVTTDKDTAGTSCFAAQGKSVDEGIAQCCETYSYDSKTYYSCALHNKIDNHLESIESERQACIYNIDGISKLMAYVEKFNASCISLRTDVTKFNECVNNTMSTVGINKNSVASCISNKDGLKYLIEDYNYTLSVGGINTSPTYMINKTKVSPKSQDNFKQYVCSGFNNAPSECGTVIEATTTSSGGSCG